ncbi:MAG: HD domain-containing protein [Pseudomonadota bacterium]|jgi:(p)ppGpp synthase/HD superfamily hydrolase|nr:HD domain-containing protein [Alphaproteobacteria bacterium]
MEDIDIWQLRFDSCFYSEKLLNKISLKNQNQNDQSVDIHEVKKAIYYAKKYHGSQKRKSGEPYYSHPLEVAYNVSDYLFKADALVVCILHDTIEDTSLTFEMISKIFNLSIANQVNSLTRIKGDKKITSAEIVETLWVEKKYDLLLIKLFDRLHNIQTLKSVSKEKAQKTITETLKYFLVLSEMMKLPNLCDYLYSECCKATIVSGIIENSGRGFDQQFKLPDPRALAFGNA